MTSRPNRRARSSGSDCREPEAFGNYRTSDLTPAIHHKPLIRLDPAEPSSRHLRSPASRTPCLGVLKTGSSPIAEIVAEAGYGAPEAFAPAFKRATDISPAAWRRAPDSRQANSRLRPVDGRSSHLRRRSRKRCGVQTGFDQSRSDSGGGGEGTGVERSLFWERLTRGLSPAPPGRSARPGRDAFRILGSVSV